MKNELIKEVVIYDSNGATEKVSLVKDTFDDEEGNLEMFNIYHIFITECSNKKEETSDFLDSSISEEIARRKFDLFVQAYKLI